MQFLQELHGAIGLLVLCCLLFVEETGIPLPFAPGEVTLVLSGLLVASGGLDPYIAAPCLMVACIAGGTVGFEWSRLVGVAGLRSVARRLHQEKSVDRVSSRLANAGPIKIGISRLVPGLRIYTTLVAGAVGVTRRSFLTGMVPATIVWVVVWMVLGAAIGLPLAHIFTRVERLALQGLVLLIVGVGIYVAVRRSPGSGAMGLARINPKVRTVVAIGVDLGIVASVGDGLLTIGPRLLGIGFSLGWIDPVVVCGLFAIFYLLVLRGSVGATIGEALLQTTYASNRSLPHTPKAALHAVASLHRNHDGDVMGSAAALLRSVSDPRRLSLLAHMAGKPLTIGDYVAQAGTPRAEVEHDLVRLQELRLVAATAHAAIATYTLTEAGQRIVTPLLHTLDVISVAQHVEEPGTGGSSNGETTPNPPGKDEDQPQDAGASSSVHPSSLPEGLAVSQERDAPLLAKKRPTRPKRPTGGRKSPPPAAQ